VRVLLDECVPRTLAREFGPAHEVRTLRDEGWLGIKDNALVDAAASAGFDAMITVDRGFAGRTDMPLPVLVVAVGSTRVQVLREYMPNILTWLESYRGWREA